MNKLFYAALSGSLLLSACADNDDATPTVDEDTGMTRSDQEQGTDDFSITASDFGREQLGAKIQGPAGPEVEGSLTTDLASLGDIKSYVACPQNITNCDPNSLPSDTIYTFVHVVTPGVDEPNDKAIPQPEAVEPVSKAVTFRMRMPVNGFTGQAGYSLDEARAALGPQGSFTVRCDEGMIIWEVASGETWGTGEPITFFWKSKVPPKGPAKAYAFEGDGKTATATGPFPAAATGTDKSGCT